MNSSDPIIDPFETLGVTPAATTEEISSAYYEGIRRHPPDKDPEGFKSIRRAFEMLENAETRARLRLFNVRSLDRVEELPAILPSVRKFTGPRPWLDVLKEAKG